MRRRRRVPAVPQAPDPSEIGPIGDVLGLLAGPACVMTATHEGVRAGVVVRSCLPCADEPVLLAVAIRKGHRIDPLVRDSRSFVLCVLRADDRVSVRRFADLGDESEGGADEPGHFVDQFDAVRTTRLFSAAPVLVGCAAAIDCEVVRHVDLDADHALYVGQVMRAALYAST